MAHRTDQPATCEEAQPQPSYARQVLEDLARILTEFDPTADINNGDLEAALDTAHDRVLANLPDQAAGECMSWAYGALPKPVSGTRHNYGHRVLAAAEGL